MEAKKIVYRWLEAFDGGIGSEYFNTISACKKDMIEHVRNIRLTRAELDKLKKEFGAYVVIEKVYLDEDGEEIDFEDTKHVRYLNERTLNRIY